MTAHFSIGGFNSMNRSQRTKKIPSRCVGCGSYWWGPQILETSEDCSSITALPLQDQSEYVFSGTNTYGCTWDTTVTVAWLAPGCMDPEAFNYDEAAACPGSACILRNRVNSLGLKIGWSCRWGCFPRNQVPHMGFTGKVNG